MSERDEPRTGPVVRATAWSMGGYALSQVIRFGGNLIMTRLMFPDVFGLASLVFTFIYGLVMFSDVGVAPAVIQSPKGDEPSFLDTAWTVQAIRGGILFLASCAIALPVSWIYEQPMLVWLVPAAGLQALLSGFGSMSLVTAQRHLQLQRIFFVELVSQVINIGTVIGLAVLLRGIIGPEDLRLVWAVIVGTVLGEFFKFMVSHLALPGIRHRFRLDPEAKKVLFSFGRWVFLSTLLTFLANQSDRLIFAKMIPLETLGVYGIAAALGTLPALAVQRLSSAVLFPAYAKRQDRHDFRDVFWRGRLPVLLAGGTLVSGLIASGPFLVRLLYDDRYADASWILVFLTASAWFQVLEATNSAALLALGRVNWMAAGNATKLVSMLVLLWLGFRLGGFPGALLGLVLSDAARYVTSALGAARIGLLGIGADLVITALAAVIAVGGAWAGRSAAFGPRPQLAAFLVSGTVAALAWGLIGLWYWRRKRSRQAEEADQADADGPTLAPGPAAGGPPERVTGD